MVALTVKEANHVCMFHMPTENVVKLRILYFLRVKALNPTYHVTCQCEKPNVVLGLKFW